ncbi:unnamed protein product [Urochloa decumbens]|uniref:Uncharacterized protein n=1 Tax=Urochloa decumbens TaxID=240449 RepID=A0ABC8VGR2_9POAL
MPMGHVGRELVASASDGVENLKITVLEPHESLKRKESSASEEEVDADADLIRRLKKEALALIRKDLPEEAQPPVKKRKKIIKQRLPQGLIDYMMENPFILREIPQERLTARSQRFLESYAKEKAIADKVLQYEQALINQYLTKGYAEREVEVTDDESEEN